MAKPTKVRPGHLAKFGKYLKSAVSDAGAETIATVPTTVASYYVLNKLDKIKEKKEKDAEAKRNAMAPAKVAKIERDNRINHLRRMSELQDVRQLFWEPKAAVTAVAKPVVKAAQGASAANAKKYAHAAKDPSYKSTNPYEYHPPENKPGAMTPAQKMAQPSSQMQPPRPSSTSQMSPAPTTTSAPPSPTMKPKGYVAPGHVAYRHQNHESAINYMQIGDFIKGYFDIVYQVLNVVMVDIKKGYKSMRIRQAHTDALKRVLYSAFMDYRNQDSFQRLDSQLQKISLKFDRFDPLNKGARNENVENSVAVIG